MGKKQVKKAAQKGKRILAKWMVMIINYIFTTMMSLPQAIHHSQGISYIISFKYRKNSLPIIEKQRGLKISVLENPGRNRTMGSQLGIIEKHF